MSERARRIVVVVLLLAPLVALHVRFAPRRGPFSADPSYYMQVARFVAEENRLLTNVSLYHEALVPLPQPYRLYPLWPLVLGIAAKVMGLFAAANVLPQLLYVIDLLLLYAAANRIDGRVFAIGGEPLTAGHLVVLVAGLNFIFFQATIDPYTEGLAVTLALGSLLVLERSGAASGALAGLAFLARYQFVALPMATAVVLLTRSRRALASYAISAAVVATPWLLYARGLEQRANVPLAENWIHAPIPLQTARGLAVAFNPWGRASLFQSFGWMVLVVPLGCALWRRMNAVALSMLLTGLVATVTLTHFQSVRPDHWLFGERHALLFLFAIVPSAVVCLTSEWRALRVCAMLIAGLSIAQGAIAALTYPLSAGEGLTGAERQLVAHLPPSAVVLTTKAQVLSVYSRASFHWTDCDLDVESLIEHVPIDHVVVYDRESRCRFARGLEQVDAVFDDGFTRITLYGVTRKTASTGAPSTSQTATGLR